MKEFIQNIWMNNKYDHFSKYKRLLINDVSNIHTTEEIINSFSAATDLIFIPVATTVEGSPLDFGINKTIKLLIKERFTNLSYTKYIHS